MTANSNNVYDAWMRVVKRVTLRRSFYDRGPLAIDYQVFSCVTALGEGMMHRGVAAVGRDSDGTVWTGDPGWFGDELLSPRRCRQISPSSTLREPPYNRAELFGVGGDGLRNGIGISDCGPRKKKEAGGELVGVRGWHKVGGLNIGNYAKLLCGNCAGEEGGGEDCLHLLYFRAIAGRRGR